MTVVVDASVVVSALVDDDAHGHWAEEQLLATHLVAPHILPVETANILRRSILSGSVSEDIGSLTHADLLSLPIDLFPYAAFASRAWELRANLTLYDAWYVALAEALDAPLATLDRKLSRASGCRCPFLPPAAL